MNGELTKVEIRAFKNKDMLDRNELQELGRFVLPINPEQLSQSFKVELNSEQAQGSQGTNPVYKFTLPEDLKLDFMLDGSGVVPVKDDPGEFHKDVVSQIQKLLRLTYEMDPETHKPNFLRLLWGDFTFGKKNCFNCVLKDLSINYTLFSPQGKPLRAKVSAAFVSHVEPKVRVREEGKESTDVTHVRKIKAGQTLPLMTYRIYGEPNYYLQIAKANGLVNFRRLRTNDDLHFPPVREAET